MSGYIGDLSTEQKQTLYALYERILSSVGDGTTDTSSVANSVNDSDSNIDKKAKAKRPKFKLSKKKKSLSQNNISPEKIDPEDMIASLWEAANAQDPDLLALKFLRARKFDLDKSYAMLQACLEWRVRLNIEAMMEQGEVGGVVDLQQFRTGKIYFRGCDAKGRPIAYIQARKHDKDGQTPEEMERLCIYVMERGRLLVENNVDTCILVFDLEGFSLQNMDYYFVRFFTSVFESKYPETLGLCLIINAPFIFSACWSIIKPLLDPVVANKIVFARGTDLTQYLPAQYVPKRFGGTDTYEFVYPEPDKNAEPRSADSARAAWEEAIEVVQEATWKCIQAWKTPENQEAIAQAEAERDLAKQKYTACAKKLFATVGNRNFLHNSGVVDWDTGAVDWSKQK